MQLMTQKKTNRRSIQHYCGSLKQLIIIQHLNPYNFHTVFRTVFSNPELLFIL